MKLIKGLSGLNKEEWFSFRKFLHMNYRIDSDVIILFDLLKKGKNKLNDPKTLTKIKEKHFLGLTQKNFSNLQSKLYTELENWFVFYDTARNPLKKQLQLIISLNTRGLFKNATQIFQKLESELLQSKTLSMETNQFLHKLYHAMYYSDNPIKYRNPNLFSSLVNSFFDHIQEQSLTYAAESHNWQNIKKVDLSNEKQMLENITQLLPLNRTAQSISLLKSVIIDHDVEAFQKLYESIINDEFKRHTELIIIVHIYMIHYCSILMNEGKLHDIRKIGQLLDKAFETGTVLSQGKMPVVRFLNYVGYYKDKLAKEQAIQFIEKWVHYVNTNDIDTTKKVALAQVAFSNEEYSEILEIIKENISLDTGIKIRGQVLLLIAYAEDLDKYYEILSNSLTNFYRQLKRSKNKVGENFYKGVMNIAKIIETIKEYKYTGNTINLEDYNTIIYRSWVVKKIKQGY